VETDLVNAQLDAADKPEERIAVLERGVKEESEFLKMVEARFNAGTVTEADVRQARSCLLDVRIRLLRERGPKDKVVAQIKAAQKERVKVLTELVEICTAQFRVGTISCEFLLWAEANLINAQMDATDKHEDRVALLEQAVKREAKFLNAAEARHTVTQATVTQADVYRARSLVLTAKIGLLEEGSPNDKVAAQIKALQKEQIEALTQLVKLVEDEYQKGATEFGTLLSAETALINAQVNAADTAEAKVLVLTNADKKETDFLKIVDARFQAGTVTKADVCQAQSLLLDFKIRLLRERGL
jgi:outer membrane protein TolC